MCANPSSISESTLWLGIILVVLGIGVLMTADGISAALLGIGPTPYSYRWLQQAINHERVGALIDVLGGGLYLSGITIGLRALELDRFQTPTKWGTRIAGGYIVLLSLAVVLGFVCGALRGSQAGDSLFFVSFVVLYPVYILADSIVNAHFLHCALRAAALPFSGGLAFSLATGWADPLSVSVIYGSIYSAGSLVVVGIARAIRKPDRA